jgi:hypothetical protein
MEQLKIFEELEDLLEKGMTTELSEQNRNPALSDRFRIRPGEVYRLIISGMNPMDQLQIDGVLEKVVAYFDSKGFTLHEVSMRDCLVSDSMGWRKPSRNEYVRFRDGTRVIGFGYIVDSEGFWRARERELKKERGECDSGREGLQEV